MVHNEELSTKHAGIFPDNFVGKEEQRQNVGNSAEKCRICWKISKKGETGNLARSLQSLLKLIKSI